MGQTAEAELDERGRGGTREVGGGTREAGVCEVSQAVMDSVDSSS